VPTDLDLHLVLDNYATHKTPATHQWLLKHPRFCLHFHAHQLQLVNLVERWFAECWSGQLSPGMLVQVRGAPAWISVSEISRCCVRFCVSWR
jgi:hypothetical protein